jgi:hypothetical protein
MIYVISETTALQHNLNNRFHLSYETLPSLRRIIKWVVDLRRCMLSDILGCCVSGHNRSAGIPEFS